MSASSQEELWLSEHHLDYHRRQFLEPYRSTVYLRQFVCDTLDDYTLPYRALDVACGGGATFII